MSEEKELLEEIYKTLNQDISPTIVMASESNVIGLISKLVSDYQDLKNAFEDLK
jgi:hypothetical protein